MDGIVQPLALLAFALLILLFFGPIVVIVSIIGSVSYGDTKIVDLTKLKPVFRFVIAIVGLGSWLALYYPLVTLAYQAVKPAAVAQLPTPTASEPLPTQPLPSATASETPTAPPSATAIVVPTTEAPPTATWTPTSTASATETATWTATATTSPSRTPEPFYLLSHRNGQSLGCAQGGECIIPVRVQWVPQALTAGRRLYILVRPLPEQAGYSYWVQQLPENVRQGQWESSEVHIGVAADPSGTHFLLCAILSYDAFDRGRELGQIPATILRKACIDLYR